MLALNFLNYSWMIERIGWWMGINKDQIREKGEEGSSLSKPTATTKTTTTTRTKIFTELSDQTSAFRL